MSTVNPKEARTRSRPGHPYAITIAYLQCDVMVSKVATYLVNSLNINLIFMPGLSPTLLELYTQGDFNIYLSTRNGSMKRVPGGRRSYHKIDKWWCSGHLVLYIDCLTVCPYGIFLFLSARTYDTVTYPFFPKHDCKFGSNPVGITITWMFIHLQTCSTKKCDNLVVEVDIFTIFFCVTQNTFNKINIKKQNRSCIAQQVFYSSTLY